MNMLISLGFLFISILNGGAFVVQPAWGSDLKVTFENEVAGITQGMEILSPYKGVLLGNENQEVVANSSNYSNFNNPSKKKSPDYSDRKKITTNKKYANAGFIVSDLVPVGTITNLFENKLGTTGPDEIIVDIGKRQGIAKGDRFTVYNLDRYIYHPVLRVGMFEKLGEYMRRKGYEHKMMPYPGKPVGYRVMIQGVVEITELGDEISSARVVKAYESIEAGYLLTPYKNYEDKTSMFSESDKSIEGYIVASKGDKIGISTGDFIYIDKGWEDQVSPGDHFEVFRIPNSEEYIWYKLKTKKTPLLPNMRGEIKIIDTQKKTATAIVVKSKIDMVIGDQIRFKRSNQPG
jgi:hypothetical protein